jgi:hypothetical protein
VRIDDASGRIGLRHWERLEIVDELAPMGVSTKIRSVICSVLHMIRKTIEADRKIEERVLDLVLESRTTQHFLYANRVGCRQWRKLNRESKWPLRAREFCQTSKPDVSSRPRRTPRVRPSLS